MAQQLAYLHTICIMPNIHKQCSNIPIISDKYIHIGELPLTCVKYLGITLAFKQNVIVSYF